MTKTIADLLEKAVTAIAVSPNKSTLLTVSRARGKAERIFPTENQERLLSFIESRGFVPFPETLGMDWRFLGGLFTRGLVSWNRVGRAWGVTPASKVTSVGKVR